MTVSPGGTISWTPATDSVYTEHVEYLVVNDDGRKDTLTFNMFVQFGLRAPPNAKPSPVKKSGAKRSR